MTAYRLYLTALLLALAAAITVPAPAHAHDGADDYAASRPYSCRLLDDEERKCAFGSCDRRTVERLRKECLRDGGRS